MRTIQLTQGKVALVDDEDYDNVNRYKWYAHNKRYTFVADRRQRLDKNIYTTQSMHRFILNPHPHLEVDHIDGNGLNNQRSNLRVVTSRENHNNLHGRHISKFTGVSWDKKGQKWMSIIRINYKTVYLGRYKNEEDAAMAYIEAKNKLPIEYRKTTRLYGDSLMCADGKQSYREQGYEPRKADELWEQSPMNPKNKKKQSTGTEFLERYVR